MTYLYRVLIRVYLSILIHICYYTLLASGENYIAPAIIPSWALLIAKRMPSNSARTTISGSGLHGALEGTTALCMHHEAASN